MSKRLFFVRNDSGSTKRFFDQVLSPGQEWEIIERKLDNWRDDEAVAGAITSGTLTVGNGSEWFIPARGAVYFYDEPAYTSIVWPNNSLIGVVSGTNLFGGPKYTFVPKAFTANPRLVVSSGTDGINLDITPEPAIIGEGLTTVTSGSQTISISSVDNEDVDSITVSGTTVTGSVNFETVGGVSLSADAGTSTVTVSGGGTVGSFVGSFFQVEFTKGGTARNTWLAVGDAALTGNRTPWVVAFPCRLVAIVFSNINKNVDTDVEIHVSREGDGNSDTLEYTWPLTNVRTASITDIPEGTLDLLPGDKVAVYLNDTGGNPKDVFVGVYLEVTSRQTIETTENWGGNF